MAAATRAADDIFLADVMAGLAAPQKFIPGKYLWDLEGSRIFEAIVLTPAYYHTRAERDLTDVAMGEIAPLLGRGACVVEFGSGSSRKVRAILDRLEAPSRYVALDISEDYLNAAVAGIAADYPTLEVHAVCADYSQPLPLLPVDRARGVLGFLPGTSIGNMVPDTAVRLLAQLRATLAPGYLLIGQDPNRDQALLDAAYEGRLMTALHKNVLARLANELGATLDPDAFRHESRTFDNRVEPHLVALADTAIRVGGRDFALTRGESIRTDLSWKYTIEDFSALAASAGWMVARRWPDARQRFCLYLLEAR